MNRIVLFSNLLILAVIAYFGAQFLFDGADEWYAPRSEVAWRQLNSPDQDLLLERRACETEGCTHEFRLEIPRERWNGLASVCVVTCDGRPVEPACFAGPRLDFRARSQCPAGADTAGLEFTARGDRGSFVLEFD